MVKKITSAQDFLPKKKTLPSLQKAAEKCRGCHLYKNATQVVFGEGAAHAKVMVVGEIPGNKEDITGRPFQGPAGTLLRQSLESSGMDLDELYFTNVVKHFKFQILNNKRMHRSPSNAEVNACVPWLTTEIEVIQPRIIICLGAIAAKTLVDKKVQVKIQHGQWFPQENRRILITFHPSAILRTRDDDDRHKLKAMFIRDLKKVRRAMK